MDELIRKQDAIDAVNRALDRETLLNRLVRKVAIDAIRIIPPVQPETATVTIGRTRGETTMWYECDACGEPVDLNDNYCRNCGRKLIHD